jgi:hypothetical protein
MHNRARKNHVIRQIRTVRDTATVNRRSDDVERPFMLGVKAVLEGNSASKGIEILEHPANSYETVGILVLLNQMLINRHIVSVVIGAAL